MLSVGVNSRQYHHHIQLIKIHTSNVQLAHPPNEQIYCHWKCDWLKITSLSLLFRMPRTRSVRFLSNIRSKLPLTFLRAIFFSLLNHYMVRLTNLYLQFPLSFIFLIIKHSISQKILPIFRIICTFHHLFPFYKLKNKRKTKENLWRKKKSFHCGPLVFALSLHNQYIPNMRHTLRTQNK